MCQTGSRKFAADDIDIDQLHYLNAECPFWVLYYNSMGYTSCSSFWSICLFGNPGNVDLKLFMHFFCIHVDML